MVSRALVVHHSSQRDSFYYEGTYSKGVLAKRILFVLQESLFWGKCKDSLILIDELSKVVL